MTTFPHDRFDDVTEGPRVGVHRGAARRGRGWVAFAWAALATGVLVGAGALALALANNSFQFDSGTSGGASSSSAPSATGTPTGAASSAPAASAAKPSAQGSTSVVVLNGTATAGLAATGTSTLESAGWTVTSDGNAGSTDASATIVYYRDAAQADVARGIAETLGVGAAQQSNAFPDADVTVVLGADYAA